MSSREKYPKYQFPISDEFCAFMDLQPCFFNSLKLSNEDRFTFLPVILTSFLPDEHELHKDQVLGLFYYDKMRRIFKQDFVVNKNNNGKAFHSYVDLSTKKVCGPCDFVHLIDNFFNEYGLSGKYYHRDHCRPWMHHYRNIDELPESPELKEYARIAYSASESTSY